MNPLFKVRLEWGIYVSFANPLLIGPSKAPNENIIIILTFLRTCTIRIDIKDMRKFSIEDLDVGDKF